MTHMQILLMIIMFMLGAVSLSLLFIVYSKEKYALARYFMIITFLMTILVTIIMFSLYFFLYQLFPQLIHWLRLAANLIYCVLISQWIITAYPVNLFPLFKTIDRISKGLAVLQSAAVIILFLFYEKYIFMIALTNLFLGILSLIFNCWIVFSEKNPANFKGGINWNLYTKFNLMVYIILYPCYILIFLATNKNFDLNYFVFTSFFITILAYIFNSIFSIIFLIRSLLKPHYQITALSITPSSAEHYGFSDREAQIAAKLVEGMSYSNIGQSLFIGTETVKTYVKSIYRKTGAKRRQDLANILQNIR